MCFQKQIIRQDIANLDMKNDWCYNSFWNNDDKGSANLSKKYISEVIKDNYKNWKKGDIILIKSPTGSGKSEFIKKKLLNWCKDQHKSMLLLSNRTLLYKQQISDIESNLTGGFTKITLGLYQTFEESIENYDYVVCDECHYFFEDASFNRFTDIIYKKIQNYGSVKIYAQISLQVLRE